MAKPMFLNNLKRYDEAIKYYHQVLAIDLTNVNALNDKALALQNLQKYDESIKYYDKALSIEPRDIIPLNKSYYFRFRKI